jgi:hypothetical protein
MARFDWYHYLRFADELHAQACPDLVSAGSTPWTPDKECLLRNCISRAYYGTYTHVRNFMRSKSKFFPAGTPADHGDLIDLCKRHPDFTMKDIGKNLEWLRSRRNDCDYEDELSLIKDLEVEADKALERAFETVDEFLKEAAKLKWD